MTGVVVWLNSSHHFFGWRQLCTKQLQKKFTIVDLSLDFGISKMKIKCTHLHAIMHYGVIN